MVGQRAILQILLTPLLQFNRLLGNRIPPFVLWPWPVIVAESDAYRSSGLLRHVLSTPNMFWQVIVAPLLLVGFYVGLRRPLGVANKG